MCDVKRGGMRLMPESFDDAFRTSNNKAGLVLNTAKAEALLLSLWPILPL